MRLHLEEHHRIVPVGAGQVPHQQREHLLVGGRQQELGAAPVGQREDVVAVLGPAAARLVRLARQQRREEHLLAADRGHLLPDDLGDPVEHQLAQRQPGVAARRGPPDVAGPQQQPVARHLRVGRVLAQGPEEHRGHPQQHRAAA